MNLKKLLLLAIITMAIIATTYAAFVKSPIQVCTPTSVDPNDSLPPIDFNYIICVSANWMIEYPILNIIGYIILELFWGFLFWSILVDPIKKDLEEMNNGR